MHTQKTNHPSELWGKQVNLSLTTRRLGCWQRKPYGEPTSALTDSGMSGQASMHSACTTTVAAIGMNFGA